MLTIIVYLASPAARRALGIVKLSGHMNIATIEKQWIRLKPVLVASGDRWKSPTTGTATIVITMLVARIPAYAINISFFPYLLASSGFFAPIHWPITVIIAMPIALPGILANIVTELATELAAMAAVPNVETRLETESLPIWNMPFSNPLGRPIDRIFLMIEGDGRKSLQVFILIADSALNISPIIIMADMIREIRVAKATPATPISNTNINKAFPQILIMFMIRLVFMLILLFPILLKRAAPAL